MLPFLESASMGSKKSWWLRQVFETRANREHSIPPPASSRFIVLDRGDASPRCMRATLNCVPTTPDLARIGAMPFGIVLCPLALPNPRDDPIQVRALGTSSPRPKSLMHPQQLFSPYKAS